MHSGLPTGQASKGMGVKGTTGGGGVIPFFPFPFSSFLFLFLLMSFHGVGRNGNVMIPVALMAPLTTPIFDLYKVISDLTTPLTNPTPTPPVAIEN